MLAVLAKGLKVVRRYYYYLTYVLEKPGITIIKFP